MAILKYKNLFIGLILYLIVIYLCSCSYTEPIVQDEYITIYDKDWNVKYYGKIRKE